MQSLFPIEDKNDFFQSPETLRQPAPNPMAVKKSSPNPAAQIHGGRGEQLVVVQQSMRNTTHDLPRDRGQQLVVVQQSMRNTTQDLPRDRGQQLVVVQQSMRNTTQDLPRDRGEQFFVVQQSIRNTTQDLPRDRGEQLVVVQQSMRNTTEDLPRDRGEQLVVVQQSMRNTTEDLPRDRGEQLVVVQQSMRNTTQDLPRDRGEQLVVVQQSMRNTTEDLPRDRGEQLVEVQQSMRNTTEDLPRDRGEQLVVVQQSMRNTTQDLPRDRGEQLVEVQQSMRNTTQDLPRDRGEQLVVVQQSMRNTTQDLSRDRGEQLVVVQQSMRNTTQDNGSTVDTGHGLNCVNGSHYVGGDTKDTHRHNNSERANGVRVNAELDRENKRIHNRRNFRKVRHSSLGTSRASSRHLKNRGNSLAIFSVKTTRANSGSGKKGRKNNLEHRKPGPGKVPYSHGSSSLKRDKPLTNVIQAFENYMKFKVPTRLKSLSPTEGNRNSHNKHSNEKFRVTYRDRHDPVRSHNGYKFSKLSKVPKLNVESKETILMQKFIKALIKVNTLAQHQCFIDTMSHKSWRGRSLASERKCMPYALAQFKSSERQDQKMSRPQYSQRDLLKNHSPIPFREEKLLQRSRREIDFRPERDFATRANVLRAKNSGKRSVLEQSQNKFTQYFNRNSHRPTLRRFNYSHISFDALGSQSKVSGLLGHRTYDRYRFGGKNLSRYSQKLIHLPPNDDQLYREHLVSKLRRSEPNIVSYPDHHIAKRSTRSELRQRSQFQSMVAPLSLPASDPLDFDVENFLGLDTPARGQKTVKADEVTVKAAGRSEKHSHIPDSAQNSSSEQRVREEETSIMLAHLDQAMRAVKMFSLSEKIHIKDDSDTVKQILTAAQDKLANLFQHLGCERCTEKACNKNSETVAGEEMFTETRLKPLILQKTPDDHVTQRSIGGPSMQYEDLESLSHSLICLLTTNFTRMLEKTIEEMEAFEESVLPSVKHNHMILLRQILRAEMPDRLKADSSQEESGSEFTHNEDQNSVTPSLDRILTGRLDPKVLLQQVRAREYRNRSKASLHQNKLFRDTFQTDTENTLTLT